MEARDKYTVFSPTSPGYRKGIHKVPKWTRVGSFSSIVYTCISRSFAVNKPGQSQGLLVSPHCLHIVYLCIHITLDLINESTAL